MTALAVMTRQTRAFLGGGGGGVLMTVQSETPSEEEKQSGFKKTNT